VITFKGIADKVIQRSPHNAEIWQAIVVGEETGEMLKEFRRWGGAARSAGSKEKFAEELADVVIASYVLAELTGIDLMGEIVVKLSKIEDRGGL
jgi:NTP pyrophosphatase (non-canonical NTP hydrolase)